MKLFLFLEKLIKFLECFSPSFGALGYNVVKDIGGDLRAVGPKGKSIAELAIVFQLFPSEKLQYGNRRPPAQLALGVADRTTAHFVWNASQKMLAAGSSDGLSFLAKRQLQVGIVIVRDLRHDDNDLHLFGHVRGLEEELQER